jgi:phosphoribosylaminoimidazolecarboxamide formyltransferase/IMP cyclohydrolase
MSAFGGVIALNREVDEELAEALHQQFVEVLYAPGYTEAALAVLCQKQNLRILQNDERRGPPRGEPAVRQVSGGLLVQDPDGVRDDREGMEVVTRRQPTEAEWGDLLFAWRVAKHVKSNAIVLARDLATVGIGAGQMSRVDSVRLSIEKAQAELAARCWPPTRSSRSPTGRSSRSRRGSRRSSSQGGRSATTRSSPPPTRPASRWS